LEPARGEADRARGGCSSSARAGIPHHGQSDCGLPPSGGPRVAKNRLSLTRARERAAEASPKSALPLVRLAISRPTRRTKRPSDFARWVRASRLISKMWCRFRCGAEVKVLLNGFHSLPRKHLSAMAALPDIELPQNEGKRRREIRHNRRMVRDVFTQTAEDRGRWHINSLVGKAPIVQWSCR
jgi:hypothetical protein